MKNKKQIKKTVYLSPATAKRLEKQAKAEGVSLTRLMSRILDGVGA